MSKILRKIQEITLPYINIKEPLEVDWLYYKKDPNRLLTQLPTNIPKIIWIYWESTEKNLLVELCNHQIKNLCTNFEVIILNRSNIESYIGKLPDFHADLPIQNIADYIRLSLLKKYGGVWIDATVFLTEDLNWILNKISNYDAFLFYTDDCTIDIQNPISENWLIAAPKKSPFIEAWYSEFKRCIESPNPQEYYSHLYQDPSIIQKMGNPQYLICYISAIIVLRENNFNILYARSGSVGHYFNYKFNWNSNKISIAVLVKKTQHIAIPKLIKFTGEARFHTEQRLKNQKFNRYSLLGKSAYQNKIVS